MSDVSGWEKNFGEDFTFATTKVIEGCAIEKSVYLSRSLDWWAVTLFRNYGCVADGLLFKFTKDMVQRSGNYLTTTSNGIGRAAIAYYAGSVPFCCGDDCVEFSKVSVEQLRLNYVSTGLPLRDVEVCSPGVYTFCSHTFTSVGGQWKCWLHCWQRMLWECSRNASSDAGSDCNWKKEVQDMTDVELRQKILNFIDYRAMLVSASGHD